MRIKQDGDFERGYTSLSEINGKNSDMLMDFGILVLEKDDPFTDDAPLERVLVLLNGEIKVCYEDKEFTVSRDNCFDEFLWCLNAPRNVKISVVGIAEKTELAVIRTENDKDFPVMVYEKDKIVNEVRGENTMDDCGRRMVRTSMDVRLTPHSKIMMGEDVHFPGRWAGFPSHHHRQPEIYFCRFWPKQGFGLMKLGDEGVLIEENDTFIIKPNYVHPLVATPGYALYFLWIIRHLDNDPYIKPTFEEEHMWVTEPDAKYWPHNI